MNRDLKSEFFLIQKKYIGKDLTNTTMEQIKCDFQKLFNDFNLLDLQWILNRSENSIIFVPLRTIDKLAIYGISSL